MKHEVVKEDARLFEPLIRTSGRFYVTVAVLLAIIALGGYAYLRQLLYGLGVTGLNRPVFWGLYMTNFVFFIGISHAGTLVSAILRVARAEWRRPITRAAEAITVFVLPMGALQVIIDLGRPDRVLNVFRYGRLQSPLLWDVISICVYLMTCVSYLYLPLIPDIALCRDGLQDIPRWRKRLYRMLSLGWTGTEKQWRILEKGIDILAVLVIPIAVSVHTVVGWVWGMTIVPGWHTAIIGPYFVTGAIFSGIASVLIAMAIIRKVFHLEDYLKPVHFNNLGLLLIVMVLLWAYFTLAEHMTDIYGNEPAHMSVLLSKLTGEFAPYFWGMVICNLAIPFLLLFSRRTRTITGTVIAAVMIVIGMWLERFTIIIPSPTRPRLPYGIGFYHPTWVEVSIMAASFAAFILLYVLFAKVFPIVSIWEVREGREKALIEAEERIKSYMPGRLVGTD
jgi:Ni/Fe-hydrogenase subunit HybB-like protein